MGTVHLTNGHHGLYIREKNQDLSRRVLLDATLLNRPILATHNRRPASNDSAIRAALQGLMDLPKFDAAVSYEVIDHVGVPHIALPKRVWGEITLGTPDNVVVGFSHDARFENQPYSTLFDWMDEDLNLAAMTKQEYERFCGTWSSREKWRAFFETRIGREIATVRNKAETLRAEALMIDARADIIEGVLT